MDLPCRLTTQMPVRSEHRSLPRDSPGTILFTIADYRFRVMYPALKLAGLDWVRGCGIKLVILLFIRGWS